MSGKGQRFIDGGYDTPKPLIQIKQKPMFINSLKSFPTFSKLFLVVTEEISKNNKFIKSLNDIPYKNEIISLENTTRGQAESCYIAVKEVEENTPFFVGPCDLELNEKINLQSLFVNDAEIIILTYKPKKINFSFPNDYGWVESDVDSLVYKIEVKSNKNINKINAEIISGVFIFKNKNIFIKFYEVMLEKEFLINDEYYLDSLCKIALGKGSKINTLLVQDITSYGTPQEIGKLN
jgi:bifunctional N-acetylglucosamine-1-phosphate-uridyltransferase/glucosamine-1-phosphate-acetyltransferase GlmU-like protein